MDRLAALDRIIELLDAPDGPTTNTSMRLPDNLREAAALAVGALDLAPSATTLTTDALRAALEHLAFRAGLEAHYEAHPQVRPSLAQIALARAEQDGSPLADDPVSIERAAADIQRMHPDADAGDVLIWAEAQQALGS
jgi:hypothetical protein